MGSRRIKEGMLIDEIIVEMSRGSVPAQDVCMELISLSKSFDSRILDLGALIILDTFGIYEDRIRKLWNDVCGRNTKMMITLLYACRFEIASVNAGTLNHAIDNCGGSIDIDTTFEEVLRFFSELNPKTVV